MFPSVWQLTLHPHLWISQASERFFTPCALGKYGGAPLSLFGKPSGVTGKFNRSFYWAMISCTELRAPEAVRSPSSCARVPGLAGKSFAEVLS